MHHIETLRAVVETIVPGPPHDPTAGALEADADRFLDEIVSRMGAEAIGGLIMLLDGMADGVVSGARFSELELMQREEALRAIGESENEDLRQILRTLFSLTVAAVYGEWSGQGGRPASWDAVGYPGPSSGYELDRG